MKYSIYITLSLVLLACFSSGNKQDTKATKSDTSVLFVAPYKVDCVGVGPMNCLLVKREINQQWENFYSPIKGFQHEAGISYKIKVKTRKKKNIPADASSLAYELIEIIESHPYNPNTQVLHDIWGVVEVMGENPLKSNCEQTIEINLADSIAMGKGGCNNYRGEISILENSNRIKFKNILASRRTCPHQSLENKYIQTLNQVDAYFRFNQNLYLLHNDTVIIKCKRMD
ncbi:DUF4377 domain-containing protein [Carboxylicivirga sp. A043]|uniref:DUF4377 domain-containing protein n=1 Tax=Carboxylicivirga litoralis TaxID=2816963 RepID=UPI0021CB2962|nr:DUF4377 domain-containing protein [Carboxylicivirga sp. A043]MCU4157320.1 DUF4377 domain-containing protein [Carboxylicivirga sp. A043]